MQKIATGSAYPGAIKKTLLIMRLTILLLLASILTVHATGTSQSITLSGKNLKLTTIFKSIEKQTGYVTFGNESLLKVANSVTVSVRDMPLEQFLDMILKDQPVEYVLQGEKTIVLTRKKEINLPDDVPEEPTLVPIRGRVVDSAGQPLSGATIVVRRSKLSTSTDANGQFSIDAEEGDVLIVSFVSMETRSVTVNREMLSGSNGITISLNPSVSDLDEINIVSTGYQTLSKERSTGSFERINERRLNRKINQNIFSKLEGEVAGVTTDAEGKFIVRGLSSIRANTDPLVVVDGFPVEQGANTINPNDVESITILKDAAAASIWGIRAANGVIVITTKKGSRNGKVNISASASLSMTPKPDLFSVPLGDPATQVAYQQALYEKGNYFKVADLFAGVLNPSTGRVLNPVAETLLLKERGDISASEAEQRLQQLAQLDSRSEYANLIQQSESWQQYNVAFIDPKGNIVSNNAPRPSDESLRKMLDGLLDN